MLRPKPIADRLQASSIITRGEAIGQLREAESFGLRLALRPFVSICPHFARVGKVGAQLDEAEAEFGIGDIKVIDGDPAVLLHEAVVRSARTLLTFVGRAVVGNQHGLELLADTDGDHAGLRSGFEVGLDQIDLAVAPGEADDGMRCRLAKMDTALRKTSPIRWIRAGEAMG